MPDPFTHTLVLPPLGFAGSRLDRAEQRRQGCEALLQHPSAKFLAFHELRPILDSSPAALWLPAASIPAGVPWIFLGLDDGSPRFAASVPDAAAFPGEAIDLRSAAGLLPFSEAAILAHARAVLSWHANHGHCAVCGAKTQSAKGGYQRKCESCGAEHFPRTDPVVIMLVIDGERCLLGRQPKFRPGSYSCLAGFIEPGETIEEAVAREVFEEAGVRVGRVRYVASQPSPFPSTLMIGCFSEAPTTEITIDHTEL